MKNIASETQTTEIKFLHDEDDRIFAAKCIQEVSVAVETSGLCSIEKLEILRTALKLLSRKAERQLGFDYPTVIKALAGLPFADGNWIFVDENGEDGFKIDEYAPEAFMTPYLGGQKTYYSEKSCILWHLSLFGGTQTRIKCLKRVA